MPKIRVASRQDCLEIAVLLRIADRQEIEAVRGNKDYYAAILDCFTNSSHCFCIENDEGRSTAIYGVAPDPNCKTAGIVWMMATSELGTISKWFIRNSQNVIDTVSVEPYEVLWNLIDLRNEVHVRWLKHCGFEFGVTHPGFGPQERPFQMFHKRITPREGTRVCAT